MSGTTIHQLDEVVSHEGFVKAQVCRLAWLPSMEAEGRKPSGPIALTYDRTACAVPL
jgi:hypothetical protein